MPASLMTRTQKLGFAFEKCPDLLGRIGPALVTERQQAVLHVRIGERSNRVGIYFRDDFALDRSESKTWMWTSGHNGQIRRAAHGYEPTREAAMAAFAESWRRE
jgi:hypothetical protein